MRRRDNTYLYLSATGSASPIQRSRPSPSESSTLRASADGRTNGRRISYVVATLKELFLKKERMSMRDYRSSVQAAGKTGPGQRPKDP